jgi:cardiolipin synthase (CMP-forming)
VKNLHKAPKLNTKTKTTGSMLYQLPNFLTISRIIAIPLIIICYIIQGKYGQVFAASLFTIACITDFLDGYLARTLSLQSRLGSFLDPIADKLLVGSVIVLLVYYRKADLLPAIAIICREILVSGLREFLAEVNVSVPVSNLAKFKTGFQMAAILMLLLANDKADLLSLHLIGNIALWIAATLTLFTGYIYLKSGIKHLN